MDIEKALEGPSIDSCIYNFLGVLFVVIGTLVITQQVSTDIFLKCSNNILQISYKQIFGHLIL